jgi:DNA-binding transcriptional ArsR family regulator
MAQTALAFQALADPVRLALLERLLRGEQAVNDLVEQVDIHQSGVSRHLQALAEAGLVRVRPDGQRRLYSIDPEGFRAVDAWLDRFRALWEQRLDRFGAALEKKTKARKANR